MDAYQCCWKITTRVPAVRIFSPELEESLIMFLSGVIAKRRRTGLCNCVNQGVRGLPLRVISLCLVTPATPSPPAATHTHPPSPPAATLSSCHTPSPSPPTATLSSCHTPVSPSLVYTPFTNFPLPHKSFYSPAKSFRQPLPPPLPCHTPPCPSLLHSFHTCALFPAVSLPTALLNPSDTPLPPP